MAGTNLNININNADEISPEQLAALPEQAQEYLENLIKTLDEASRNAVKREYFAEVEWANMPDATEQELAEKTYNQLKHEHNGVPVRNGTTDEPVQVKPSREFPDYEKRIEYAEKALNLASKYYSSGEGRSALSPQAGQEEQKRLEQKADKMGITIEEAREREEQELREVEAEIAG